MLSGCFLIDYLLDRDDAVNEALNIATRQCPAFSHPELANWIPETEGDIASFSNSAGETALFTTGALTVSEPYSQEGEIGVAEDDIPCSLTAVSSGTSSALYPQLSYEYLYRDIASLGTQDEPLRLTITLSNDEGELLSPKFGFDLLSTSVPVDKNPLAETQYFPTLTIGNSQYTDVISQRLANTFVELVQDTNSTPTENIVGVLVARGVGLVQFELANGSVYSRNP